MILTIINVVILVLNLIVYLANRKIRFSNIYSLPIFDGQGVKILNKEGKPVVIFDKPLK